MNREEFLEALNQVKPALATKEFIPVFSHFCFDKKTIMAYNDLIAIKVKFKTPLHGAVRGEKLINILENSDGKELKLDQKKQEVIGKVGRTNIKLPILGPDEFLFNFPKTKSNDTILFDDDYMEGIRTCLVSASQDTASPEQMGITLKIEKKKVTMYSTDNVSISKFVVGKNKEKVPENILLLPTEFCRVLSAMARLLPEDDAPLLVLEKNAVIAKIGENCEVFSKLILDVEPLDFEKVILKHTKAMKGDMLKMPSGLPKALTRSAVLLDASEGDCQFTIAKNTLKMHTESRFGEIKDSMKLDGKHPDITVHTDPILLHRVSDICKEIYILDRCIVMGNDKYQHLISNHAD